MHSLQTPDNSKISVLFNQKRKLSKRNHCFACSTVKYCCELYHYRFLNISNKRIYELSATYSAFSIRWAKQWFIRLSMNCSFNSWIFKTKTKFIYKTCSICEYFQFLFLHSHKEREKYLFQSINVLILFR